MTNSHNPDRNNSNHNNQRDTNNTSKNNPNNCDTNKPNNCDDDKSHNSNKNNTHNNTTNDSFGSNSKKSFSSDTDDQTRNGANTAHTLKAGTKSENTDSGSALRSNKPTSDGDELDDNSDDKTKIFNNKKS